MKKLLALSAVAAFSGSAMAADLPARYSKAPALVAPAYNWTGFYIFGGAGGGLWNADSNLQSTGVVGPFGAFGPAGTALTRDQRFGGSGWFGTVGIGYDWQFGGKWVAGIFGDGQFGDIRGSLIDPEAGEGREKLRASYAAGARVGYLVAPNVLSYVNGGYSGSEWSGSSLSTLNPAGGPTRATTPSFRRDGWFIGGGVENNLDIFGITAPGWFMKTEYRSAFYDRTSLPETFVAAPGGLLPGGLIGYAVTFKPWVQTISTSLVYRFNWGGGPTAMAADLPARYAKAPAPVAPAYNWTGFYLFGGAGGGLWAADSNVETFPGAVAITRDQRQGGSGWFGTVGIGYDWQFNGPWVAGIFGDGQFGDIRGSLTDSPVEGREKLRTSYAAGVRAGYLVAPNVLSYVNGGYSGSEWSGSSLSDLLAGGGPTLATTPSFRRDGWFVGGGVENNLNIFGISAPGWFMKTEYRSAFYDRISLPETNVATGALNGRAITFKPWVQTISTSLVYRFNWGGPPVAPRY